MRGKWGFHRGGRAREELGFGESGLGNEAVFDCHTILYHARQEGLGTESFREVSRSQVGETNFPRHALVRTLKRFLLPTVQAAILLVGFAVAIVSAEHLDSAGNDLAVVSFFSCLAIAIAGLALVRRVSRKWKLRWDVEAYLEFRARVQRSLSRTKLFERMRRGAM